MSETLRITCPCGYENWVPAEKRGQVVPCFICGEDLLIEETAADPSPSTSATGSAPSTPSINKPRSPFEADDVETAVRPKFQHAPPAPAPAAPPVARPRSPFEADAPPEDEAFRRGNGDNLVADPFSRELVPAPKPAPSMIDEMEKHRPTERRSRHTFIDTISPHDAPTGEKCMQCGKPLRGSWDRVETHLGVFCYVCSNQATHDIPERVKAGSGHRAELRESELLVDPVNIRNAAPLEQKVGFTQTPGFRKLLLWMAWGVLGIAFLVWLTGWGSAPPPSRRSALGEAPAPIPVFIQYIFWALGGIAMFSGAIAAIYLTLDRDGRLPHERFLLNVVNIGALFLLVAALAAAGGLAGEMMLGDSPFRIGWNMLLCIILFVLFIYLLMEWFDFQLLDFFWLFFFYMPMVQILVGGTGYFIRWGLYQLVI